MAIRNGIITPEQSILPAQFEAQPLRVGSLAVGQMGYIDPTGLFPDRDGGTWLNDYGLVKSGPDEFRSLWIARIVDGMAADIENVDYRWQRSNHIPPEDSYTRVTALITNSEERALVMDALHKITGSDLLS